MPATRTNPATGKRGRPKGTAKKAPLKTPVAKGRAKTPKQKASGLASLLAGAAGSDLESQVADLWELMDPQAWRTEAPEGAKMRRSKCGNALETLEVKVLVAEHRKLRRKCMYCGGHPHAGCWGHNANDCVLSRATDGDTPMRCSICTELLDPEDASSFRKCSVCRLLVHETCGEGAEVDFLCTLCVGINVRPSSGGAAVNVNAGLGGLVAAETLSVVSSGAAPLPHPIFGDGGDASAIISTLGGEGGADEAPAATRAKSGAPTGEQPHVATGLRGLGVVQKTPKSESRPLLPRDFLISNSENFSGVTSTGSRLVVGEDGEITTETRRKERECKDAVEWAACNARLQAHLLKTQVLKAEEVTGYTEHTLKIMDLSTKKLWSAVIEYDLLYRFAVHAGSIRWGARHEEAYESAFLDKVDGAALVGGKRAVSCALCGSDEHATLGGNCPFRGKLLTSGDPSGGGGAGKPGGGSKYTKSDRRNVNNAIKRIVAEAEAPRGRREQVNPE